MRADAISPCVKGPAFRLATPSLCRGCGLLFCQHPVFKLVRIAITEAAFKAIARTLPLGSGGVEPKANKHLIWLEDAMADRLGAMRGPGESFSDAIIRIAGQEALATRRG
jgi:hypothetical protein